MTISLNKKTKTIETLLKPRFYTTNFIEISNMNIKKNLSEIQAVVEEFRYDYNRDHFIRDQSFEVKLKNLDSRTKDLFAGFLERSCTAEFSGFLLYKEISRNLKNKVPLLAEAFAFMARDEARHAGFLNKAINDFNFSLDLGFLTKSRDYTFFAPKFIFYSTYLSEKIGYWRYITLYRHLEKSPQYQLYPLFSFFESWCQDENRHGDFFAALLKSQESLLFGTKAKLWCKFFLLSVFVTMYFNDIQRKDFYELLGLDVVEFDRYVIQKTNQSASSLFPSVLDVNNPKFFELLDVASKIYHNLTLVESSGNNLFVVLFKKTWFMISLFTILMRLFFL